MKKATINKASAQSFHKRPKYSAPPAIDLGNPLRSLVYRRDDL